MLFATVFFLAIYLLGASDAQKTTNATVKVEQGSLRGEVRNLITGNGTYYSFKGIPYAAPPVGNLRFKAPQPPKSWTGVRNATQHGASCPQSATFIGTVIPPNEDCLFLNVNTQNLKPSKPLPVIVFIHGGGYRSGSGNDSFYSPDFLVQRGVVVVTINYRLDSLGFLSLDNKDVPGNAGLKDQVAALNWVKKNIARFGGDPTKVTVAGQSSGGASVGYHILSPLSKGLFTRAIAMSGTPLCEWTLPFEARRHAIVFGRSLGIYTNNTEELLKKLQALPVATLIQDPRPALLENERYFNILKNYYFTPVIEQDFGQKAFLLEDVEDTLNSGNINDVDVMIGQTSNEGLSTIGVFPSLYDEYDRYPENLVPNSILHNYEPLTSLIISEKIRQRYFGQSKISNQTIGALVSYISHSTYDYQIRRFANLLPSSTTRSRYFYQFSGVGNRNVFGSQGRAFNLTGAGHFDDVFYIFDPKQFNLPINKTSTDFKIINQTSTLFTNFVKFGNPTPDNSLRVTWKQYKVESPNYLDIGEKLTPLTSLNEQDIAFWQSVYDDAANSVSAAKV